MKRPLPPFYVKVGVPLALLLHFYLPVARVIAIPYNYVAGGLLLAVGAWLSIRPSMMFEKRQTTIKPYERASMLIQDGPFRISRHPMYLGMVVFLLGLAVVLGTLTPLIVPLAVFLMLHFGFVLPEEKSMRDAFGKEYDDYCRRVRRWL